MQLRLYLARHAGEILGELRHATVKNHYHLPKSILDRTMRKLDAAALHLNSLSPGQKKSISPLAHRADQDCLHALIFCASSLDCTELYNRLLQHLRD